MGPDEVPEPPSYRGLDYEEFDFDAIEPREIRQLNVKKTRDLTNSWHEQFEDVRGTIEIGEYTWRVAVQEDGDGYAVRFYHPDDIHYEETREEIYTERPPSGDVREFTESVIEALERNRTAPRQAR